MTSSQLHAPLQVVLSPNVPAHWKLLKARLKAICPDINGTVPLWRYNSPKDFQNPFLLQVTSYDRAGVLHGRVAKAAILSQYILGVC